jgi:hypothetical protein
MIRWIIDVNVHFSLHLLGIGIKQSQGIGLLERMVHQQGQANGASFLTIPLPIVHPLEVVFSGAWSHFGEVQGVGEDADFDFLPGAEVAALGWEHGNPVG